MVTELGMPLVAGVAVLGLSGELSGRPCSASGPSVRRLNWLASDSSRLSSVVMALLPLKSRLSSLHSLLSSPREGWLAVRFSSRSLQYVSAQKGSNARYIIIRHVKNARILQLLSHLSRKNTKNWIIPGSKMREIAAFLGLPL